MNGFSPHYSRILNQNDGVSRSEVVADGISIWDDGDAFIEAFNASPEAIRQDHLKATRRRGGLRAVAEKAVRARYGTAFADYESGIHGIDRKEVVAAYDLLRDVAGLGVDHDGKGFDKNDVPLGHALASATMDTVIASPGYSLLAISLSAKYRVRRSRDRFMQSMRS